MSTIIDNIDIKELLTEVENTNLWKEDTFYKTIQEDIFSKIDTITLRYANEGSLENKDSSIYHLFPKVKEAVFYLMSLVQGERLGGVMLNKLLPGTNIPLHSDGKASELYYHRFHIVLSTNSNVVTKVGEEELNMQQGDVWWFDHALPHTIINNGTTDRIHLVVDIKIPNSIVVETPDKDLSGFITDDPLHGFEHYLADQVFIKQIPLRSKGTLVKGHSHTYDHISLLATGAVSMFIEDKFVADYIAPCGILVPKNIKHEFISLADNTILYCIHNTHSNEYDELEDALLIKD